MCVCLLVVLDVVSGDNKRNTPLILATKVQHVEVVKLLLETAANPLYRNMDGLSARDIALAHKDFECAKLLEEYESSHGGGKFSPFVQGLWVWGEDTHFDLCLNYAWDLLCVHSLRLCWCVFCRHVFCF
jgi:ankyrin repeat protein